MTCHCRKQIKCVQADGRQSVEGKKRDVEITRRKIATVLGLIVTESADNKLVSHLQSAGK